MKNGYMVLGLFLRCFEILGEIYLVARREIIFRSKFAVERVY